MVSCKCPVSSSGQVLSPPATGGARWGQGGKRHTAPGESACKPLAARAARHGEDKFFTLWFMMLFDLIIKTALQSLSIYRDSLTVHYTPHSAWGPSIPHPFTPRILSAR